MNMDGEKMPEVDTYAAEQARYEEASRRFSALQFAVTINRDGAVAEVLANATQIYEWLSGKPEGVTAQ